MIELLLEAERALAVGLLDNAERLYRQAADNDPRNAMAIVGLARVALERDDEPRAFELGQRALTVDPDNRVARQLVDRIREIRAHRGDPGLPEDTLASQRPPPAPEPAPPTGAPPPEPRPGALGRLRRWLGRR